MNKDRQVCLVGAGRLLVPVTQQVTLSGTDWAAWGGEAGAGRPSALCAAGTDTFASTDAVIKAQGAPGVGDGPRADAVVTQCL